MRGLGGLPFRIFEANTVLAGWSSDHKFKVKTEDGIFLLRISPEDQYDRKRQAFDAMKKIEKLDVPMSRAVRFGRCNTGVYVLQEWIEGEGAERAISSLPQGEQARLGKEAGRYLHIIHSIKRQGVFEAWDTLFNRKIDQRIRAYRDCPLKLCDDAMFFDAIDQYRPLLKDRPQSCQHGDYHVGNMMIDRKGQLVLIDFDRLDFGDPWEEFNRLSWSVDASPAFASACVDAYFSDNIPSDFWKLLKLYLSVDALSSLPWAIPFGEADVLNMHRKAKLILSWYDDAHPLVPHWYEGN